MNTDNPKEKNPEWPYRSLLWYGFFGMDSPGGKTLVLRTTAALLIFIVGALLASIPDPLWLKIVGALMVPAAAAFIMWSGWRYLNGLDELSRLIQLRAYAFSYGAAIVLAMTMYSLEISACISISPLWLILVEPLRGISLYVIAKQYQ